MAGLITLPALGWGSGTLAGALASQLLPPFVSDAMGILLYGMFIAIFVPVARKSRPVLLAVLFAAGISSIFHYLLPFIGGGFAIIFSAVISSAICAALFPIEEEEHA